MDAGAIAGLVVGAVVLGLAVFLLAALGRDSKEKAREDHHSDRRAALAYDVVFVILLSIPLVAFFLHQTFQRIFDINSPLLAIGAILSVLYVTLATIERLASREFVERLDSHIQSREGHPALRRQIKWIGWVALLTTVIGVLIAFR